GAGAPPLPRHRRRGDKQQAGGARGRRRPPSGSGHGHDLDRDRRPRRGHRPAGRHRGAAGGPGRGGGGAPGGGVRGGVDEAGGRIVLFPTLPPAWTGAPFGEPLAERVGLPVALINDARAFTLAESRMGAAAGCPTVVCLTLGTGVGAGWWSTGGCGSVPPGGPGSSATRSSTSTGPR